MNETNLPGKTTLSPDVLLTITKMAVIGTEGVARLAETPGGFDRLFRRGIHQGLQIKTEDGLVYLDLFVILQKDVNVREVSRNIQHQVARAIEEMVGMEIGHVNVHIEDIDYAQ